MAANDSVVTSSHYDRLFGNPPEASPLDLPGAAGRAVSRDIFDGNPPGTSAKKPILSPVEQAIVDGVVDRLAKIARNTNFTASLPAHSTPMFWSNNIDKSATVVVPAAVTAYQTVCSYKAPPSRYGLVAQYGFDVAGGAYTYDGSLLWRFMLNGVPVQDLLDIAEHRGSLVQPSDTFIVVPMGQTLQFQVARAVAAGGTSTVAMKFKGWDWLLRTNAEGTKSSITAF
jgi:hypothetical protein